MDGGNKVQRTTDTFPPISYRVGSSGANLGHAVEIFVNLSSSDTGGLGYSQQGLKLILTHLILTISIWDHVLVHTVLASRLQGGSSSTPAIL